MRTRTIIYGAGGAIGGAVARAFAREGASVFLAGRTLAKLDTVADVGNAAAFLASDLAGATTGTVFNLTSGTVVD